MILLVKGLIREFRTKSSKATLDSQRGISVEGECQRMTHVHSLVTYSICLCLQFCAQLSPALDTDLSCTLDHPSIAHTVAQDASLKRHVTPSAHHIHPKCLPVPFLIMYHTMHMRCCRPNLVVVIFFSVGLRCKGLKSAKLLETATRSKKHKTTVEGERLRTVHIMERTCICMRAHVYIPCPPKPIRMISEFFRSI